MRPLVLLVLAVLGLAPSVGSAQAPIQDFQSWSQVQGSAPLDGLLPGLGVTLESTVRRGSPGSVDALTGESRDGAVTYLFVRPSVTYDVLPHLQLALGYAFAPMFYDDPTRTDVIEHRVWEQASTSHRVGRIRLSTRSRLEERMRTQGQGDGETELRLRERLRVAIGMDPEGTVSWVFADEVLVFFNETSFESLPGFSENRGFTGLSYRADDHLTVEVGYLNQYVGGRIGTHRDHHVLSTSLAFTLG